MEPSCFGRDARMEQKLQFRVRVEKSGGSPGSGSHGSDPNCGKRMVPVVTISGRTDLQCISCDDPGVKWAVSPLTAPEKPIVPERV